MTEPRKLSPSTLNLFLECPRCFWLDKVRKVKRPRGIFPSLPAGMDREIKNHFDKYRSKNLLPPELGGVQFEGVRLFQDQAKLDRWRNWKTGLEYRDADASILSGALDDLLVKRDQYIPFDYKTKGSPTSEAEAVRYYQNQLDCYALLLEANGFSLEGYGYLLYYSPKAISEHGNALFELQAIKVATDPRRARHTFSMALKLLRGPVPPVNAGCEYCAWIARLTALEIPVV